jgi:rod shape-determining protein MreD
LSGARPLEPWRWLGMPMLQAMAATIVFGIPLRVFGMQLPEPVFPMDLFWGGPLGLWALCLLIAYGVALAGRSMMAGQNRVILCIWYGLATATALVAGYLFVMLDSRSSPGLIPIAWQFLATIVLYPFAQRLIDLFEDADVRFR